MANERRVLTRLPAQYALAVALLTVLATLGCSAPKPFPQRVIDRPLTLHKGMMEANVEIGAQLLDNREVGVPGRLAVSLGDAHWTFGLTDRVTWAIPATLRFGVLGGDPSRTEVALDVGLLPATFPTGATLLVMTAGAEVKGRLSRRLWWEQRTTLVLLRHFDGALFASGRLFAGLAEQLSDQFSIRLGLAASRGLRITTATAMPRDRWTVSTRFMWTLHHSVDLFSDMGGRFAVGDDPERVPFIHGGLRVRW